MTDLVVIGLGYVGLPLVAEATRAGLEVVGLDVSERVVEGLNSGRSHVDDLSDAEVKELLERGFRATDKAEIIRGASTVVICVPTPLSADGGPDLTAVTAATKMIGNHLAPGTLVVLESTTYPGTTSELVRPILEGISELKAGEDFYLAFSPERIDPGNPRFNLRNTPKVVGGETQECCAAAEAFYSRVVDRVVRAAGTREAEAAKLLENTYRHVNIALINEMARFFHELDIDFWNVIELASSKPFGFQTFYPGPGVGGHCIPIDPNYLSYRVRSKLGYSFRFVELAQEINATMPAYVAQRTQELLNRKRLPVNGSKVLLLGVTYKPNIADERESPAVGVAKALSDLGADLSFHDPFVGYWDVIGRPREPDLDRATREADAVVLLQNHEAYEVDALARSSKIFFDTRGASRDSTAHRL